MKGQFD